MEALRDEYRLELEQIAKDIQASDECQKFLEEEEEEDYRLLQEVFEIKISTLHHMIAEKFPLQLVSFERILLSPDFEGLFLPKILGYSVLRGEINEHFKYIRPQTHFKDTLLAICNSSNFDIIKKRIGQTIQMGFALSSDIWITNLINETSNKKIRYFLQSQKLDKYRPIESRTIGYNRYNRQFKAEMFQTADFPENKAELKIFFSSLRQFLLHRIQKQANNESLIPKISAFLTNKEFINTTEHIQMMMLYGNFFEKDTNSEKATRDLFTSQRKENAEFVDQYLLFLLDLHKNDVIVDSAADKRASAVIDKSVEDKLAEYYTLTDLIHSKGYVNQDVIDAIKTFYNQHAGLSVINECIRFVIFRYFYKVIKNLGVKEYGELFSLSKIFPVYIRIFSNQKFNQQVKDLCMRYVKKMLRFYTDKRARDYQDIKKFVSATFLDLKFLKEKEISEMFKTRRKKKPTV